MNMGVESFNIATSATLIVAQRLARRLCQHCRRAVHFPKEALIEFGFTPEEITPDFVVYEPGSCDQCTNGYKGRVGLYEVMPVSEAIANIIMEGGNAFTIADQAKKDGVVFLYRAGLNKVKLGLTSLEEVNSVTKE